ncbi:MAG: patatin-like phospholipase family protein [Myxococcales bacterium]|nr:patatin-like phospholipase family protein [Myxococcales bacterium]
MGIRIVQKSDPSTRRRGAKVALVLAGGAVSGGAYKIGGLKALNDYLVNLDATDFDLYVGLSAGSILAASLAADISPEELLKSLSGESEVVSQLKPVDFFYPNFDEVLGIPGEIARDLWGFVPNALGTLLAHYPNVRAETVAAIEAFRDKPSYSGLERIVLPTAEALGTVVKLPSVFDYLPGGLFDNRRIERYFRENLEHLGLPNDFQGLRARTGRDLFVTATNLDNAERVVFGAGEDETLSISEAIQASTALPGFYKPARLRGVDYVDGAVRRTASLDVAVEHGADLVICYNPLRPFHNHVPIKYDEASGEWKSTKSRLADRGIVIIISQVIRTLLHTRLHYAMDQYAADPNFHGDIILVEPTSYEYRFFDINPLAFWKRVQAAQHGFFSVQRSIRRRFKEIEGVLALYGIEMSSKYVDEDIREMRHAEDIREVADILQTPSPAHVASGI